MSPSEPSQNTLEMETSSEPLAQRTSGRRAQRRQRQDQDEAARQQSAGERSPEKSSVIPTTTTRRGPSDERERLIEQAIDQRKHVLSHGMTTTFQEEILSNYEYLDHTADVQLHSWGDTLENALEELVIAMFGYMTKLSTIDINEDESARFGSKIEAKGQDLQSMVFHYLQEWLCIFHESGFVAKQVTVQALDRNSFTVQSTGKGERVDWHRHAQGTEIKAVTYSNLQVVELPRRCDVYVIVDI
jgi:SHS2 domain-containing protein